MFLAARFVYKGTQTYAHYVCVCACICLVHIVYAPSQRMANYLKCIQRDTKYITNAVAKSWKFPLLHSFPHQANRQRASQPAIDAKLRLSLTLSARDKERERERDYNITER